MKVGSSAALELQIVLIGRPRCWYQNSIAPRWLPCRQRLRIRNSRSDMIMSSVRSLFLGSGSCRSFPRGSRFRRRLQPITLTDGQGNASDNRVAIHCVTTTSVAHRKTCNAPGCSGQIIVLKSQLTQFLSQLIQPVPIRGDKKSFRFL